MTIRFPVKAAVRSDKDDSPKPATPTLTVGIFDSYGYWAHFNTGSIELPGDMLDLGNKIASIANAAYEQGRTDQAATIMDALTYGAEQ